MNRIKPILIYILIIISTLFTSVFSKDYTGDGLGSQLINLEGSWEYRNGDSPMDSKGNLLWLNDSVGNTNWKSVNKPSDLQRLSVENNLWIRLRLKDYSISNPAIFITRVEKIFEVYFNNSKIYSFGEFANAKKIPLMGFAWHLIKLPDSLKGHMLTFRIRSDYQYIGIYGDIKIGPSDAFLYNIVKNNSDKTILGIVFIVSGIIFFIILLFLGKLKPFIGMIIFQVSTGIWTLANSPLTQMIFYSPRAMFYADHIALFVSAIGFFMLAVEITELKYEVIFKRIYLVLTCYLAIAIITDIVTYPAHVDTVGPFLVITSVSGLILIWCFFASARRGNPEAKILLTALVVYTGFVLADIINYFNNVVISNGTYEMRYTHYGGFCFLIFLAWIIVNQYVKMKRQVILSQKNERERIARDLHDEVGARLTEIKLVSERVKKENTSIDELKEKLTELSEASDDVISKFSEIVWALNPLNDNLEELGTYIGQYAVDFLRKADIRCRLDFPPEFPMMKISYEIQRDIIMAIKESLNNIIKHACASIVTVKISVEKKNLIIIINDDGHGFETDNTRKYGHGLKNIDRRIKNIGGTATIKSEINIGTITNMIIPLSEMNHQ